LIEPISLDAPKLHTCHTSFIREHQIIRELPIGLQDNAISDRIISLTDHGLYTDLSDVLSTDSIFQFKC